MVALATEAWTWYGVAITIVLMRFVARFLQLKHVKRFQLEDFCMLAVTALYTVDLVLIIIAAETPTNLIPPEELSNLNEESVRRRIYGSKIIIALEQLFITTQWGCKACLLLLYANLTIGLRQYLAVKIVACYTLGAYVLMQILYFGVWCRPFYNYWSVPAASPQCSTYLHHLTVNVVFNISSDLAIFLIPLPLLAKTQLPIRKKIALCAVFSVGIFVILSAILNKYYSFTQPYGSLWVYWYVREISTAVIVANLPHGWALVRRAFNLSSFMRENSADTGMSLRYTGRGGTRTRVGPVSRSNRRNSAESSVRPLRPPKENAPSDTESIEVLGCRPSGLPLEIWECKELRYSFEHIDKDGECSEHKARDPSPVHDEDTSRGIKKGEITTVCKAVTKDDV